MAERPGFADTLVAIGEFLQRQSSLTEAQIGVVTQIRQRIERLNRRAARLAELNDKLWELDDPKISLDQSTSILRFEFGGIVQTIQLERLNPDTPLEMKELARVSAYFPEQDGPLSDDVQCSRHQLEEELEAFYSDAHRIQKSVQRLLGLKQDECKAIAIVRNQILEHPIMGITNSYGYGSSGPKLSAFQTHGSIFQDEGLFPNVVAFDSWLTRVFKRAA